MTTGFLVLYITHVRGRSHVTLDQYFSNFYYITHASMRWLLCLWYDLYEGEGGGGGVMSYFESPNE